MIKLRTISVWLYLLLFLAPAAAQQTIIKASIDSTHLLIGEQAHIHLEIIQPKGKAIQLPTPKDTLTAGVEVLAITSPDTTVLSDNNIQINQDYLITSFDSAIYILPPFEIVDGLDTIRSNSLGLKVSTLPVDLESKEFFDIKDVISPPFVLSDYAAIIWIILGIIVLILVAWYLYQWRKGRRSLNIFAKPDKPKLPPHIVAINELDNVKLRKLWQQGLNKEYYSSITDILRVYMEDRFGTHAMEMTSGEILAAIRPLIEVDSAYNGLKQVLQLGDFVKFAKYQPIADENELSLINAYLFVNQTKVEEKEEENKEEKLEDKVRS